MIWNVKDYSSSATAWWVKIRQTPSSITFYHLHPLIYKTCHLDPLIYQKTKTGYTLSTVRVKLPIRHSLNWDTNVQNSTARTKTSSHTKPPSTPHVHLLVVLPPRQLLWRHIVRCPHGPHHSTYHCTPPLNHLAEPKLASFNLLRGSKGSTSTIGRHNQYKPLLPLATATYQHHRLHQLHRYHHRWILNNDNAPTISEIPNFKFQALTPKFVFKLNGFQNPYLSLVQAHPHLLRPEISEGGDF